MFDKDRDDMESLENWLDKEDWGLDDALKVTGNGRSGGGKSGGIITPEI